MNKKDSLMCEFEIDLKKSFCCAFNLSNDDIISVLCKQFILRFVTISSLKTGAENSIFWSEIVIYPHCIPT